jgi:hypothetical protein
LGKPNVSSESEAFGGDEVSVADTGSNWGLVSLDDPTPKDVLKDEGPALEVRGTSPSFSEYQKMIAEYVLTLISIHDR